MPLNTVQIEEVFASFGLQAPGAAEMYALTSIIDDSVAYVDLTELPEVQSQVIPVVQMFDLATGHMQTTATLSSMVSSDLSQPQLASDLVASSTFADFYNGGVAVDPNAPVTTSLVDAMFLVALGHTPTAATEHGFSGLTNEQAFLAIATSPSTTEAMASAVQTHLIGVIGLAAGFVVGGSGPGAA